jgi:hypothetical protein
MGEEGRTERAANKTIKDKDAEERAEKLDGEKLRLKSEVVMTASRRSLTRSVQQMLESEQMRQARERERLDSKAAHAGD